MNRLNTSIPVIVNSKDQRKNSHPERWIFIILLLLTCAVLVGGAVLLFVVPFVGLTTIHPHLPIIMAIGIALVVLFLIGGALTLVFTIIRGKNLFFNRRIRFVVIRLLFPLLVLVGKCIGIKKDQVRRGFISINNQLVLSETHRVKPEKLLILLPHCLQYHECAVRITGDVENCEACGGCKIMGLASLSRKYGVPISVATGGTLARRIVVEKKPNAIIGVACERDLSEGIQDTYPIPVYGILNKRPFGPCFDTDIDLELVEKGLITFLGHESRVTKESGLKSLERTGTAAHPFR